MDDYGNDLNIYWAHDLRLLLASDQSMGAHGFCPFIGRTCFEWSMTDI